MASMTTHTEHKGEAQMGMYLMDCTRVLCEEVTEGATQKSVALTYAMALRSAAAGMDTPDWKAMNMAILARWKMSGLERIKKLAMDYATGKKDPARG